MIHFNFGIHDRNTPVADYVGRLERLVERMQQTGATLVWATTTPIPDDPEKRQTAASIVERNLAAADVMQRHGVVVDDLYAFIEPHLAEVQPPKDVHFTAQGYDMLGGRVAEAILGSLERRKGPSRVGRTEATENVERRGRPVGGRRFCVLTASVDRGELPAAGWLQADQRHGYALRAAAQGTSGCRPRRHVT